jgi:hypothetical protein
MFLIYAILFCSAISGFYLVLTFVSYLIESYQSKNYTPSEEHKRIFIFCGVLIIISFVIAIALGFR